MKTTHGINIHLRQDEESRVHLALRRMQANGLWNGSFNGKESSLQQLAPFVGKLKTGMVHSLLEHFSGEGDWVCDPFAGCGVVPFEALLMGRRAIANDLSPYAICVTRGKLTAPPALAIAIERSNSLIAYIEKHRERFDLRKVDAWVRGFFHPQTLKEILAAFEFCRKRGDSFLAACLCGILHHQRPGFLSYPASHMVPYLRDNLFPRSEYPELYAYRSVGDRLLKKVARAYRRPNLDCGWSADQYLIMQRDARILPLQDASVDLVVTSPPYYDALDYARDNRLRLWFLGLRDWRELDKRLTRSNQSYEEQMGKCLKEMSRILKPGKHCLLIVGEVQRNGKTRDTGKILGSLAYEITQGELAVDCVVDDEIPDTRRSRRGTTTTRVEKIVVLAKRSALIARHATHTAATPLRREQRRAHLVT